MVETLWKMWTDAAETVEEAAKRWRRRRPSPSSRLRSSRLGARRATIATRTPAVGKRSSCTTPFRSPAITRRVFAARNDVYSHWTADGWRPVREPLTGETVIAGLQGTGPSISGYMIAPGSVSHVAALDFDTDNGLEQAFALASFMGSHGLPAYVETSRRGAHLWCLLDRGRARGRHPRRHPRSAPGRRAAQR